MYLLFVTSPIPAPLSPCSFSLSLFFPVRAGMYVRMFICMCLWLCECEFHCFPLCECVLCNFRVVVFLRQLFGAPFFKTNHKHHEADDDNLHFLLRAFFFPPSLQPGSSLICLFCFAIVFFHKFWRELQWRSPRSVRIELSK